MTDVLKRATSASGSVRVFVSITTDVAERAREIHGAFPVATAALGRLLTASVLMSAAGLKNKSDYLTLQVRGDGKLGSLIVCCNSSLEAKGYVENPFLELPLNNKGKIDVGGGVGRGTLSVIRDLGLKEPYIGQVPLVSGEIAEDITAYYARSEQTPSAVGLGVLVDRDGSVKASGGFMVQMMPGSTDETAQKIEENLKTIKPITTMIDEGMSPEDIIFAITNGVDMLINNKEEYPKYHCDCSRERMEKALISIGKKELDDIMKEQGEAEMTCHFCDKKYNFSKDDLTNLLKIATEKSKNGENLK